MKVLLCIMCCMHLCVVCLCFAYTSSMTHALDDTCTENVQTYIYYVGTKMDLHSLPFIRLSGGKRYSSAQTPCKGAVIELCSLHYSTRQAKLNHILKHMVWERGSRVLPRMEWWLHMYARRNGSGNVPASGGWQTGGTAVQPNHHY